MESEFGVISLATRVVHQLTAKDLATPVATVFCDDSNATVLEVFGRHRDLISLPVLDGSRPMGLISRNIFMSQMSKPYHRELYEKKTCIAFMDKDPLIVGADASIETVAALAVQSGNKALADGFLIVADGALLGLGSGLDLMRMMVELQSEKNRQVMQSIDYASVIQRAMLSASNAGLAATLTDACLVWQPRDVVGGDFYHFERFDGGWFAALADCTGHGVPGAFLTLIASSALTQALVQHGPRDPAALMGEVNRRMKQALGQHSAAHRLSESDDGMDAVFLWHEDDHGSITYANARMAAFTLAPGHDKVEMLALERTGLGYIGTAPDASWSNRQLTLAPGTLVMLVSDGVIDQVGGAKNIAYGKQRVRQALLEHRALPMPLLAETLMRAHQAYQGTQRRRDDVALFGFRTQQASETSKRNKQTSKTSEKAG